MSGENQNHNTHYGHHTSEASAHGITVHKSQLEKKVMLINNNFMSRVPVYTGANTTSVNNTTSVYTVTQGQATSVAQPTSATNTAQRNGFSKLPNNDQPKTTNGRVMVVPTIHNAMVLPSHSHFSSANNNNSAYKAVYNENGLRIDRTPTDDEINNLWQNMRTILEMGGGEKGASSTSSAVMSTAAAAAHNGDYQPASRQTVHVSNKYIDGDSLGLNPLVHAANGAVYSSGGGMQKGVNGVSRIGSGSASAFTRTTPATGGQSAQSAQPKSGGQQKNGYLQRYSLLQQRRNPSTGIRSTTRNTGVVEQTLHPMPTPSNTQDPRYTQVHTSGYAPREEITESMAGFLAAEQLVQAHGTGVSDSRVMAAMESAQQQQEAYNSIRQKYAKGGPAALSMEEHRLLESLDRLNDRLKAVEDRAPVSQPSPYGGVSPGHQVFVHSTGFRGSHVRASQRRPTAGIRPTSSRLLNRLHY